MNNAARIGSARRHISSEAEASHQHNGSSYLAFSNGKITFPVLNSPGVSTV